MVTPVTKSASLDARKQITLAWSAAPATRRSGVRPISVMFDSPPAAKPHMPYPTALSSARQA
jgi:hypothetical protein